MSDPFLAEIRIFGFNFPPRGWAQCNGQLLPISQNTALFSLLGTFYGGNGTSNFALPNLLGSAACSSGQGTGLSSRSLGQAFGSATVSLTTPQIPLHTHTFNATEPTSSQAANTPSAGSRLGFTIKQRDFSGANVDTTLAPQMIGATGSGTPHANQQPFLVMNFCIALQGDFPQRQ